MTRPLRMGVPAAVALAALALWVLSVRGLHQTSLTDFGYASILPAGAYVAIALLTGAFWVLLAQRRLSRPLLLLCVGVLIFMLFGLASLVEDEPRIGAVYRHIGIIDYIDRNGSVNPNIDAYFNWPGFFAFGAFLVRMMGLRDSFVLAQWAPVAVNVLTLLPLWAILRQATSDERHRWLAVWGFLITNWVGQDYFSPQAFGYLLYLSVLAVLLTWMRAPGPVGGPALLRRLRPPREARGWRARVTARERRRAAAARVSVDRRLVATGVGAIILIFAAVVASHQLTPFAILVAVLALVIFRRLTLNGATLPLIMAVLLFGWLSYMTIAYLQGNLSNLLSAVGAVSSNVGATVSAHGAGSPDHILVVRVRLVATLGLWVLAAVGAVFRYRRGHRDATMLLLAVATFPLVALQPYGGEMLLRVYYFSLPFMAFFAVAPLVPSPAGVRSRRLLGAGAGAAVTCGAAMLLVLTRYGNERAESFTTQDVAAVRAAYALAGGPSLMVGPSINVPWSFRRYGEDNYRDFEDDLTAWPAYERDPVNPTRVVANLAKMTAAAGRPAFVVFTRSGIALAEVLHGLPDGAMERVEDAIRRSPDFRSVFRDGPSEVFVRVGTRA